MDRYVERALVISSVDYGDADRIVTLLSEGRGKLSAFAAGARKSKRRFAGALEPFTLIRARLVERHGATVRLDDAEIEQSFPAIRGELALIARALYCLELCRELVRDREPHAELFARAVEYLGVLEGGSAPPTSLLAFELDALAHAGLMPRFDPCVLCDGPLSEAPLFDPEHGGGVCGLPACRARVQFGVPARPALLTALAQLQRGAREPFSSELGQRARKLLDVFISHQLGKSLKSAAFMAQVGVDP